MFTGVAFITGATSGIGQATAQSFARKGAKRIVLVDLGDLSVTVSLLRGVETLSVQADVSDEAQVKAAMAAAVNKWGRVDYAAMAQLNNDAPGLVETPMTAGQVITEDSAPDVLPMARPGMPEELADVITFMCCEEAASYVNSVMWSVDGGPMVH
ncbi:hypothetical protein CcaverHIS002_0208980 [Cutaneotrichosporon cavernicola]|uniref:NAD(P)-binding protein n=1 Tax=Cutaneotrichosporon cavernicola TaxID=279322 RepID=A0AA48IB32_9TREE|nr:uncharacterized protein CcaverHIS019_0208990 [Cutaneotrichosporon cavernicola]BEI81738.1 hypothetical protein CcaverHIS002_0208980 [Cutaneotrichosporon cavernicola]BEI89537.1 hypothetical protein CcaverHIS019_0208990 [Cutaneotrichosporon cavernicola]BEI97310.1 hypothetical protein CcaverHIS631_0208990 [Cutaneotrichosporon cavernicola]BEJ05084.1 hypothetical protein CcaverHIS641_0209010 [Cutaneotrichosporon cavernicola]